MHAKFHVLRAEPVKPSPTRNDDADPLLVPDGLPLQEPDGRPGIRAIGALLMAIPVGLVAFLTAIVLGLSFLMSLVVYILAGSAAFAALLCWSLLTGGGEAGPAVDRRPPQARPDPRHSRRNGLPRDWRDQCVARPVNRRNRH